MTIGKGIRYILVWQRRQETRSLPESYHGCEHSRTLLTSTELREVNICLKALRLSVRQWTEYWRQVKKRTHMSSLFRNNPSQGSAGSYMQSAYIKSGHWSPATDFVILESLALTAKYYNKMLLEQQGLVLTRSHSSQDWLGRGGSL